METAESNSMTVVGTIAAVISARKKAQAVEVRRAMANEASGIREAEGISGRDSGQIMLRGHRHRILSRSRISHKCGHDKEHMVRRQECQDRLAVLAMAYASNATDPVTSLEIVERKETMHSNHEPRKEV